KSSSTSSEGGSNGTDVFSPLSLSLVKSFSPPLMRPRRSNVKIVEVAASPSFVSTVTSSWYVPFSVGSGCVNDRLNIPSASCCSTSSIAVQELDGDFHFRITDASFG